MLKYVMSVNQAFDSLKIPSCDRADGSNVQNNDQVWAAIEPSLRLATKILETNPPFWNAILDFPSHLLQVPEEKDGRTPKIKARSEYRRYRSLWPNPESAPQGYDGYAAAQDLDDLGFNARETVLARLSESKTVSPGLLSGTFH